MYILYNQFKKVFQKGYNFLFWKTFLSTTKYGKNKGNRAYIVVRRNEKKLLKKRYKFP